MRRDGDDRNALDELGCEPAASRTSALDRLESGLAVAAKSQPFTRV